MGTYSTVWGTSWSLSGLKRATVKIISGVAEMSASSLSLESLLLEVVFTEPLLLIQKGNIYITEADTVVKDVSFVVLGFSENVSRG